MQVQLLNTRLIELISELKCNNERRLILLSGSESWAHSLLTGIQKINQSLVAPEQLHSNADSSVHCLSYGDSSVLSANVNYQRYSDILGGEAEFIVFSDSRFNADALAALSGTLKSGGVFFLVMPTLNKQYQKSLFIRRFYDLVNNSNHHTVIHECDDTPPQLLGQNLEHLINQRSKPQPPYAMSCKTAEQHKAVEAIIKVVTGHRNRPLVLTADRGRGKSSALAIASAKLLNERRDSHFKIIVTAPVIAALSVFFKQLTRLLPEAKYQSNSLIIGKACLYFYPVDQLVAKPERSNLMIVDEAAGIPVYLLEQLINNYHRIVFSSTVHGYEGAGRGFSINFLKILKQRYPQFLSMQLHQPIRWRQGDPLEALVFDSCLLRAELPKLAIPTVSHKSNQHIINPLSKHVEFKRYSSAELVNDERLLAEIFAVLVTAHYQTKPSDLQLILDNSQVEVACLVLTKSIDSQSNCSLDIQNNNQLNNQVVAVALVMHEGKGLGVNADDVEAIKNAKRRLRNHFLPQSLLSHCGDQLAFNFHYLRIMRIAVHPEVQQQGLGLRLMFELKKMANEQGADFIGASFGVNYSLLQFWLKANFSLVRVGFTKDKASGEHSALLVCGLTAVTKSKQLFFQKQFYRSFDYLLLDEYQAMNSQLVRLIFAGNNVLEQQKLSELDISNVIAYTKGERQYSDCVYSLYVWFKQELLKNHTAPSKEQSLVLVARLLQKHNNTKVCHAYGLTGKKMLNQHIKNYIISRLSLN
jgi:tRNA(Met) cytidine acetyltransferase